MECKKRSREKGFHIGRESLAKEILSLRRFSNKIEVQDVLALLTRYSLVPYNERDASPRQRNSSVPRTAQNTGSTAAVNLFQQVCLGLYGMRFISEFSGALPAVAESFVATPLAGTRPLPPAAGASPQEAPCSFAHHRQQRRPHVSGCAPQALQAPVTSSLLMTD